MPYLAFRSRARLLPSRRTLSSLAVLSSLAFTAQAQEPNAELAELVSTYCTECHNFEDYSGGLDLETFDFSHIGEQADVGERMIRKMSAGVMPPPGKPRPNEKEKDLLINGLVNALDKAWEESPVLAPPGIHRMNRAEYANAISELLNLKIDPSTLLP